MLPSRSWVSISKTYASSKDKAIESKWNVVAADVLNSISLLPQLTCNTATIKINLKQNLQCKSSALSMNVRTSKAMGQQSDQFITAVYKQEGTTFDVTQENDIIVDLGNKQNTSNNVPEDLTADTDSCKVIH